MSRFIQISDFEKGYLKIAVDQYTEVDLQSFIDDNEESILRDLLGWNLYDLFIADYDAVPVGEFSEDRFSVIFNKISIEDSYCVINSEGIEHMLKHMIYFLYLTDYEISANNTGIEKNINDNVEKSTSIAKQIFARYNTGIRTYKAIQDYIALNPLSYDYSLFKGKCKEFATWL